MAGASEMVRLTASGVVGTAGKPTYLLGVSGLEGTGTVTLRNGDDGADPIKGVVSAPFTAGAEGGVGFENGLHVTLTTVTGVTIEYTQKV